MAAFNLKGSGATKFIFKFFISLIARAVRNRTSQIQIKTDEMNNTDKEKVSAKHNKPLAGLSGSKRPWRATSANIINLLCVRSYRIDWKQKRWADPTCFPAVTNLRPSAKIVHTSNGFTTSTLMLSWLSSLSPSRWAALPKKAPKNLRIRN